MHRSFTAVRSGIVRTLLATMVLASLLGASAGAQDFRVDTEVFVGEEKEPFAETLTLFADGRVYDFLIGGDEEITIFDPHMQNITLLDPKWRLKTIITVQEVNESCISLNLHAKEAKDAFFAFAVEPHFNVTEESKKHGGEQATQLTLKSDWMVYTAIGRKPEIAPAAPAYRAFADAHNKLNALRPGGMLPAPRGALNEELGSRGLLPAEITRVILPQTRFQKKLEVRSRHLFNWTLSRPDREKIETVGGYQVSFESVPFGKYRDLHNQVAAEQQAKR